MYSTENTRPINLVQVGETTTTEGWLVSNWAAGQTTIMAWSPENVIQQADGVVTLRLSPAPNRSPFPYWGGEMQSCEAASFGTWSWTAQAPRMVDGAVFGMFTYRADHFNDRWIEFDFEFVGSDTTRLRLNVHIEKASGERVTLEEARGAPVLVDLGFDAAQGFHLYEIIATGTEAIFLVDGQVVGRFGSADIPYGNWISGSMKGFVNLWCVDSSRASWAGVYGGEPLTARISAISVEPENLGTFAPAGVDTTTSGVRATTPLSE